MAEEGSVSVVEIVLVVAIFAVCLAPAAVTALKGHIALFAVGFLFGLVWLIAAFRLAKPNSAWARRYYGAEKREKSRARYPKVDPADPDRSKLALTIGFGLLAATFVAGVVAGATGT
jgi:hypothetical protein